MKVRTKVKGNSALVTCTGSLGTTGSAEFDEAIRKLDEDVCHITLNLANVSFLSSAGLKSLITVQRLCESRGGTLTLLTPSDEVMDSLNMCDLTPLFNIEH